MKAFRLYGMAMLVAAAGALASCSSDDEIANGDGVEEEKVITATFANGSGSDVETRIGFKFDNNDVINMLFSDDVMWVHSPSQSWFNKLTPVFDSKNKVGNSETTYQSEGPAKYTSSGEELMVIYTGDKTTHTAAYSGKLDTWTLDRTNVHSHDLVYIHGAKDSIPYFDKNNVFAFKAAYGYVTNKGELYGLKTTNKDGQAIVDKGSLEKEINLINYMPLLCFNIPSAGDDRQKEDEVNNVLSKLDYKIIIDVIPATETSATSGYPSKVEFTKITKTAEQTNKDETRPRDYHRCFYPTSVTLGNRMQLYYKADATTADADGKYEPASWIWHTEANHNEQYEELEYDQDRCKGFIAFPVPPVKFSLVRVRVNVSYNGTDSALKNVLDKAGILGTYEYNSKNLGKDFDLTIDATTSEHETISNKVYNLGGIWERESAISYTPSKSKAPRLAPAKVKAGKGWTKVADADFDF